jgi:TRAP-type C4-dicarboxylate transport system substrate-binding protein
MKRATPLIAAAPRAARLAPALLAAAVLALAPQARATETINLTAIDGYPTKALWVKEFIDFYIPEIDRRLAKTGNYAIKWNQAWGGQIVKPKHVLEGLQKGLGDIGVVTTVFHADKVPLQMVAYATPFVTTDPDLLARTVDDLAARFPEVKQAWAKYNQVYLTNLVVLDTYQMFAKKPLKGLADMKGMKIAGAGMNLRYLQGLGAAGVGGSLVGYYNKLKTGVVDGAMIWPAAAVSFKIFEVAPYMLDARIGTANSKVISVNAKTWAKLPDEVKTAIAEAAIDYRDHVSKVVMERAAKSYEAYQAKGGTITRLSDAERDEWASTMPNVAQDWATSLEEKGLPGRQFLGAYMDAMRAGGQTPSRQWDKE